MIKKLTLIIILALAGFHYGVAQKSALWSINPKAGVNFSDLIFTKSNSNFAFAKLGWNIGVDASYGTRWLGKGGLHFFNLGSGVEIPRDTGTYMQRLSVSQLKIPVGAGYNIYSVDYFDLWVHAQAVFSVTTSVKQDSEEAATSSYPRGGVSGRLGMGIDLWQVTMELNYEYSFTELLNELIYARNQMVSVSFGIKF